MQDLSFFKSLVAFAFMRNALIAGVVVGLVCSILSVYVVLKRLAFIGQGISHSAFGGIALGLLLFEQTAEPGLKTDAITLGFCLIVALLIGWASRGRRVSADSAIGIFFAVSMAVGVILVGLRERYTGEVFSYLFGDILAVTSSDLIATLIVAALVIAVVVAFFKEFFFFCFDEQVASVNGLPVRFLHYLLLTLLALTVVISIKVVGIVLVSAFLVIPGAAAKLLARNFRQMFLFAAVIGLASALAGLWLSYLILIPSGATIVIVQFLILLGSMLLKRATA